MSSPPFGSGRSGVVAIMQANPSLFAAILVVAIKHPVQNEIEIGLFRLIAAIVAALTCNRLCLTAFRVIVAIVTAFCVIVAIVTASCCSRHRDCSFVALVTAFRIIAAISSPPFASFVWSLLSSLPFVALVTAIARSLLSCHCHCLSFLSCRRHCSFVTIPSTPLPFAAISSPPLLVRCYLVTAVSFRCYLVTATARSLLSCHRLVTAITRSRHCLCLFVAISSPPLLVCCYIVTVTALRCYLVAADARSLLCRHRDCSFVAISLVRWYLVIANARSLLFSSPPLLVRYFRHRHCSLASSSMAKDSVLRSAGGEKFWWHDSHLPPIIYQSKCYNCRNWGVDWKVDEKIQSTKKSGSGKVDFLVDFFWSQSTFDWLWVWVDCKKSHGCGHFFEFRQVNSKLMGYECALTEKLTNVCGHSTHT